mmetsp:Transcript_37324/g.42653  ORF Transcript_37324/g.42653 Transcript_37324/m.42653 type:complete len:162 (-) Transcript_37324:296-781(-)
MQRRRREEKNKNISTMIHNVSFFQSSTTMMTTMIALFCMISFCNGFHTMLTSHAATTDVVGSAATTAMTKMTSPSFMAQQHVENALQTSSSLSFTTSTSELVSIETLDPTTLLSDVLGSLIGGPFILLIPIVAAIGVATVIAYIIVSYAAPQVDDDEYDMS